MATYITMVRSAFTGESLGIPMENLAFTFGITIIIFWIGSIYFLRRKKGGEVHMNTAKSQSDEDTTKTAIHC